MTEREPAKLWLLRLGFALVAVLSMLIYAIPTDLPDATLQNSSLRQLPGPELIFCSVIFISIRNPEMVPVWLVAMVLFLADVFLMRPLGLWTAITLVTAELFRSNRHIFIEQFFAFEWIFATLAVALALLVQQAVLVFLFSPALSGIQWIWTLVITSISYPLVAVFWRFNFGLRRPLSTDERIIGGAQ